MMLKKVHTGNLSTFKPTKSQKDREQKKWYRSFFSITPETRNSFDWTELNDSFIYQTFESYWCIEQRRVGLFAIASIVPHYSIAVRNVFAG